MFEYSYTAVVIIRRVFLVAALLLAWVNFSSTSAQERNIRRCILEVKGKIFIGTLKTATIFEGKNRFFKKLFSKISMKFLSRITEFYLEKYQADFYIPSSLKESWKMK